MGQGEPVLAALSSLGDPVRRSLYEFVAGHTEPVGRDEAAAAAGIGRPLAAYHLDKLVEPGIADGLIPAARGPGRARGRPPGQGVRPLRTRVRGHRAAARVRAGGTAPRCGHRIRPQRRKQGRAARCCPAVRYRSREALPRRDPGSEDPWHAAEKALREHGFEPWHDEEGTVRLRNCPFHHLAAQHPEIVCGMNLALVEGLVAGLGATGLHPALDPQPGCCCVAIGTGTVTDAARRTEL